MQFFETLFDTPVIFYSENREALTQQVKTELQRYFKPQNKSLLNNPDLREFFPEGKSYQYNVATIQEFLQEIHLPPYEASMKVYLFHDADKMLPVHANALLKTFEEKPSFAAILLLTENIKSILETIASRSKKIYIPTLAKKQPQVDLKESLLEALALVESGSISASISVLAKLEEKIKEEMDDELFDQIGEILLTHYQTTKRRPLDEVDRIIEDARTGWNRHIKLKQVLEYLTLKPLITSY